MVRRSTLIAYKTLSELGVRACSFLIVILAVRLLSKQDFGIFSLAWTAGWVLSVATDLGLQLFLAREVALRRSRARPIFLRLLRIKLWVSGGVFTVVVVACGVSGWPSDTPSFLVLIAAQIGISLIEFLNYYYRGLLRSELESSINLSHRILALALAALVLWWLPTLLGLASALAVATALVLAWSAHLSFRLNRLEVDVTDEWPSQVLSLRILIRQILPIGGGILFSALYFRIDLFLIELWKGTEAVALYNSVFRLVEALRLFPAAVLAVVFPELCRDASWRTLTWTCLGLLGLALVLAAASGSLAEWLVRLLFGKAYLDAVPCFKVLLVALPLLFVNFVLTHQLMAWSLQRFYALLCAGALLCNLGLNWMLIPKLSIVGAAWSTLGTEVFLIAGCLWVLAHSKMHRVSPESATEAISYRPL